MPDFSLAELSALLKSKIGAHRFTPIISSALTLAFRGHINQFREQADPTASSVPYIVHPVGVAIIAADFFDQAQLPDSFDDVISTCLTHDLLEDTTITPHELEANTSARTKELVLALTKPVATSDLDRKARNSAFIDAILLSGRTAAFVKICDAMHNLSRPEQTPKRLLEKTVLKGRMQYSQLLDPSVTDHALATAYRKKLLEVEAFLANYDGKHAITRSDDLESALQYCRDRTTRKVLEVHDVVEILTDVCRARRVEYTSLAEFTVSSGQNLQDLMPDLRQHGSGQITFPDETSNSISVRAIIYTEKHLGIGKRFIVAVGNDAPGWVSVSTLDMICTFLRSRSTLLEAASVANTLETLRALRLDMSPQTVLDENLGRSDLSAIASNIVAARSAIGLLTPMIGLADLPVWAGAVERVEHRTKSAESIVQKIRRSNQNVSEIDDIAGFRLVIRKKSDLPRVTKLVSDLIVRSDCAARSEIKTKVIRTPRGYSATHILFRTKAPADAAVEIQILTILDDAWARLSRSIDYKMNHTIAKKNEKTLKKLRGHLDEIEKLL